MTLSEPTADDREVLAPVELERFTSTKGQRNERPSTRRLLLTLPICPPFSREGRHPVVRACEAERHQIGMHLRQRLPLFAWLAGIGLQPARQLLGKGIKLARALRRREMRLGDISLQILLDGIARQSSAPRDLADRQALSKAQLPDHVQ